METKVNERNKFLDIMKNSWSFIKKYKATFIQYGALILVLIVFAILTNGKLFSSYNIKTLISQITPLLIASVGLVFIFTTGSVDVSSGAVIAVDCALMVLIINATGSIFLGLLVSIVVSIFLYLAYIFISVKLGLMSTIASLAIMFIGRGVITFICSSHDPSTIPVNNYSSTIQIFTSNTTLQIIVCVIIAFIGGVLFSFTKVGKHAKALGDNELSARQSGVKPNKTKYICALFAGLCVGIAAIFVLARSGSVTKDTGSGTEMDIMVSLILGGMALSGGAKSKFSAAIIGPITFKVLTNGMTMTGVPTEYVSLVKGLIFIVIIFLTLRQSKNIKAMPK